jgi:hypothetical protein
MLIPKNKGFHQFRKKICYSRKIDYFVGLGKKMALILKNR